MPTDEQACLDALGAAAEQLGTSPSKAEYEELGLTPASATIIRTIGSWNDAKALAGLETSPSTGSRVTPQPDDVTLPDGVSWEELSVDQRWHYRNREWNTQRTLDRRSRHRVWVNERKQSRGCRECSTDDAAVLDFHHRDPTEKTMDVGDMVTNGYAKARLREEMEKCDVLCANCHRRRHFEPPASGD